MRRGLLVGLFVVLLAALAACQQAAVDEEAPAETEGEATEDTLIIGIPNFPPSADQDLVSSPMQWLLTLYTAAWAFEPPRALTNFPGSEDLLVPVYGELEPRNFESYEVSDGGRTYTFHLKKGVESFYGNELTTEDIKWSYERIFHNNAIMMFFWGVGGLSTEALEDSFEIIDDYTFTLKIPDPNPVLLDIMGIDPYMRFDATEAKKHATEDDPYANEWIKDYGTSGFGPYVIDSWVTGESVTLKANPNYVMGKPEIDTIIMQVIPESANRVAAVRDGTIDIALELTPSQIKSLEGADGVRTVSLPLTSHIWILMNNQFPPFDDPLVRQAINHALPKDDIVETAYLGLARPWSAALPEVFPATTSASEFPYDFNLDKARDLLAEAGYEDGFEIELAYDSSFAPWETMATLMASTLAEIGIDVELRAMPSGTFTTEVNSGEMPFAIWRDAPILADPNYGMNLSYKTDAFVNWVGYSNPIVDQMLIDGATILDPEERINHHREIQRIVMEDAPIGFGFNEFANYALRDNIRGLAWIDGGKLDPKTMYFTD